MIYENGFVKLRNSFSGQDLGGVYLASALAFEDKATLDWDLGLVRTCNSLCSAAYRCKLIKKPELASNGLQSTFNLPQKQTSEFEREATLITVDNAATRTRGLEIHASLQKSTQELEFIATKANLDSTVDLFFEFPDDLKLQTGSGVILNLCGDNIPRKQSLLLQRIFALEGWTEQDKTFVSTLFNTVDFTTFAEGKVRFEAFCHPFKVPLDTRVAIGTSYGLITKGLLSTDNYLTANIDFTDYAIASDNGWNSYEKAVKATAKIDEQ